MGKRWDRLVFSGASRILQELPILDQELKFIQEGIDLFEIFAATFFGFQVQGSAKGDHIAEITKLSGRGIRVFCLLEHGFPESSQLSFDASGISLDRLSISLANEFELFGERLHW